MLSQLFKKQCFQNKSFFSTNFLKFSKINFSNNSHDVCPVTGERRDSAPLTLVRKPAPHFSGMSWWNNDFKTISLESLKGKWVCLFFYPLDFTFVCPTEIVDFNNNHEEFNKLSKFFYFYFLDCQVVGCSVDSHFSHREFALKPKVEGGLAPLTIPLLSDISHNISKSYGVLIGNEKDPLHGVSLRGTFLIDEKGILRHSTINDANVGRNVDETIRLLKAFQYADKHGEVCPAKWQPGKATMDPNPGSKKLDEFWKNEHSKSAKH